VALIIARMGNRLFSALLCCIFISVLLARAFPGVAQEPTSDGSVLNRNSSSEQSNEDIPINSVSQYLPCPDQTKTFIKLSNSFASGHLPSRSDVTGSWVLIGVWLHRDSHPELNCAGIMQGMAFDWAMLAHGYSLEIDMVGANQTSAFEPEGRRPGSLRVRAGHPFAARTRSNRATFSNERW
jgi:hypothetical protein